MPYLWVRQMVRALTVMIRGATTGLISLSMFPMLPNVPLTLVIWDNLGNRGPLLWQEFMQKSVGLGMIGDFPCLLA